MSKPKSEKRLIAEDYCKKFPNLLDRTLARRIYEENKNVFHSIEDTRTYVRVVRGHIGSHKYQKGDKSLYKDKTYCYDGKKSHPEEVYAKILILDIETAPLLANIWGIWNQNISVDSIHSDWFMLTWSAKWLFDKKIYSARVTPKEARSQDDKRIVKSLLNILSEADIVVTHNGDRFDLPRINTRALIHQLPPPLPYISIDTLKVAKRQFNFTSNKLDYINKMLGLNVKKHTDIQLWRDCFLGKEAPLKRMEQYNINDVKIQEETYLRMRPWIKPHPNVSLHILDVNETRCPACGGKDLKVNGKRYHTQVNSYELLSCNNCGSHSRRRSGLDVKSKRTVINSSSR